MEAIRPGSTSQPQVPKPLELYKDNLFDEEFHEEPVPRHPEKTALYMDMLPPANSDYDHISDTPPPDPLQPTRKELYVNLGSDLYSYFDPDEQPAAEYPPIPTKQMSVSESGYLPLLTTDYTDADNSYMGLIYEPPDPPPPPPPIQSPPPVAKDHSALAQRALQYLDPAQLDILIQMLEKLKGEPGPTAVPRPPSPLPMKKDDDLYENMHSLDVLSEAASVPLKELPPPPDRPVPGKQQFTHKADSFRKQPSCQKPAKESNLGGSLECSAFGKVFSTAVCLPFRAAAEEECNNDF